MKIVRVCEKAGLCREIATHVLVYIDKSNFQEIVDKPKFYCFHHAHYLQLVTKEQHGILSRIYPVREWIVRLEKWRYENRLKLQEKQEEMFEYEK